MFTLVIPILNLVATLTSWFCKQDLSPGLVVPEAAHGFLSWHRKSALIYPGSTVTCSFPLESFVLDLVLWSLMVGILVIIVSR